MAEYRIKDKQTGGKHYKVLNGITTYDWGQSGFNTMDPALDALASFLQTDIEMIGVGFPNGLGDPSSILNNLNAHKRFVVFNAPMVPAYGSSGSPGSMDRLVNSSMYDAAHHLSAQKLVAAGYEDDHAIRFGEEYNTEVGQAGNFPWSTGFIDPYTSAPVTISTYMKAAAKVEGIYRSEGWEGYAEWSLGTSDTGALSAAAAMPTHGDPAKTVLGYDCYIGPRYNTTKNDYASAWPAIHTAWMNYAAYARANGIMLAATEFNAGVKIPSPYALNDAAGAQFYYDIYNLWASLADIMAWAGCYQVNQFTGSYIDEMHAHFLSVNSDGGSPAGVVASAGEYTSPYPPGKSNLISGSGTNSLALSGSIDNSSSSGLHWTWNPDPNAQHRSQAYRKTFGGFGTTGGAAGLVQPVVAPVIPSGPAVGVASGKTRRTTHQQYLRFK